MTLSIQNVGALNVPDHIAYYCDGTLTDGEKTLSFGLHFQQIEQYTAKTVLYLTGPADLWANVLVTCAEYLPKSYDARCAEVIPRKSPDRRCLKCEVWWSAGSLQYHMQKIYELLRYLHRVLVLEIPTPLADFVREQMGHGQ